MAILPGAEPFFLDAGPDAPASVLISHGFTGTPQSMRPWADYLHAAGLTVQCPLLPGHGTTWRDHAKSTWPQWYAALDQALDELLKRGKPVFAMGLSMGGGLVVRLAEERGRDLAGLVVVNPSVMTARWDIRYLSPVLGLLPASVPGIGSDIKKPGVKELAYERVSLQALRSLTKFWRTVRADLHKVTVPLRVYHSLEDHTVEPVNTRVLVAGVSSTNVTKVALADSYHVATLDHDAETIFAGSLEFINEQLSADVVAEAEPTEANP